MFEHCIVVDVTGIVVLSFESSLKSYKPGKIRLDISILPDGVYSIIVTDESGDCWTAQVVKVN